MPIMTMMTQQAGEGPPPPYVAKAVHFDGATLLKSLDFTGGVVSAKGTFYNWYKCSQTDVDNNHPLSTLSNGDAGLAASQFNSYVDTSHYGAGVYPYLFQLNDAAFTNDIGFYGNADIDVATDTWQLSAFSWDIDFGVGLKHLQSLQNGVLQTVSIAFEDGAAFSVDWSIPAMFVGAFIDNTEKFFGDLSDMYLNIETNVDLSDPTVVAKIISGGKPVDQGASGSNLTGSRPFLFLAGDATGYLANKGYGVIGDNGGVFTVTGSLTNASSSPSD